MRKKEMKLLGAFFAVIMALYGIGAACGLDLTAKMPAEAAAPTEETANTDESGAMLPLAGIVVLAAVLLNQHRD